MVVFKKGMVNQVVKLVKVAKVEFKNEFSRARHGIKPGESNPQAVRFGKDCEAIAAAVADWLICRLQVARDKGISRTRQSELLSQGNQFLALLHTAVKAVNVGTDREYWLLFDSFVDESSYQSLVVIESGSRNELSRHTIHRA